MKPAPKPEGGRARSGFNKFFPKPPAPTNCEPCGAELVDGLCPFCDPEPIRRRYRDDDAA